MRFRCNRHTCGQPPKGLEFHADDPVCPRCGATGAPDVHELNDVHFIVMGKGPIRGRFGEQYVACEPDRPHLAMHHMDTYAASDVPTAVTCPRCLATKEFQELCKALFPTHWRGLERAKSNVVIGDCKGCG